MHDIAAAMEKQVTSRLANNVVTKPHIPTLNLPRHEGYGGSAGLGMDQAATARLSGNHGPGSLPHLAQGLLTTRPAYTPTPAQQHADDVIRTQTHRTAETGPITPAQALKRYSEYLTAYEQSEILQYPQVRSS
jgi:hypothetical protein